MSWEVWTMKSKLSFFDPTLLRKNISRFSPAWALLLVLFVLTGPVPLMLELDRVIPEVRTEVALEQFRNDLPMGIFFAFGAAPIFAALVFKYLHKTRSAYMMHAFPMTRNCLFLTNAVSGFLFWAVPALVTVLLELAVLAAMNVGGCWGAVWSMLGMWLLADLFFYGLAVFSMHISGNTVIAVLSYAALNFICLGLPVMVLLLVQLYFRGFDFELSGRILRMAPIIELLNDGSPDPKILWIYAAVGLILTVLAWVHYRFRQVERAGDPMAFPWARVAFRLIFTLCCALGLGFILSAFFGVLNGNEGRAFLPFALLGCFLGWFGSSMMIERTVKVFRKKNVWIGFAAFVVVLLAAVLGLKYDVLGFQRKIPETADVVSVEVWTYGDPQSRLNVSDCITLTERADIETIRDFHRNALNAANQSVDPNGLFSVGRYDNGQVHLCYRLKNGGTLRRVYRASTVDAQDLAAIFSRPDVATAWYEKMIPDPYDSVCITGLMKEEAEDGNYYQVSNDIEIRGAERKAALRSAILADAAAGRLPILNFMTGGSEQGETTIIGSDGSVYSVYPFDLHLEFDRNDPVFGQHFWYIPLCPEATETIHLFVQ